MRDTRARDPGAEAAPLVLLAVILAMTFIAGMALGTYQTRIEATKAKCAVPCGMRHVEVIVGGSTWTEWSCRCTQP